MGRYEGQSETCCESWRLTPESLTDQHQRSRPSAGRIMHSSSMPSILTMPQQESIVDCLRHKCP